MRLPFTFIFTGILGFVVFHLLSLATLSGWVGDYPRSPEGWFHVHLLILAWATMTAMGAVYQMISVVLQSKVYSERLGFIHYGCFLIGLLGLLYGFRSGSSDWIAVFATITFAGILLFVWNLAVTLFKASQWSPITISVACALAALTLTGLFGMAMGLDFALGGLGEWHERLFAAHIWMGTIGWFGFLIIGFSFKLLQMFYLAHGFSARLQHVVIWLWGTGVLAGTIVFLCGARSWWPGAAFLLITAAACVYNVHTRQIYKHRHKKQPGQGVRWATFSARWMALIGLAATVTAFIDPHLVFQEKALVLIGWGYLWGWVAMTILGYLSKIAPFLWWTHKYGPQVGKKKVPAMGDLINDAYVNRGMWLLSVSLVVLIIGIWGNWLTVIRVGGSALSLFSLGYMALVARVFTR